jgi:hypothetical protein
MQAYTFAFERGSWFRSTRKRVTNKKKHTKKTTHTNLVVNNNVEVAWVASIALVRHVARDDVACQRKGYRMRAVFFCWKEQTKTFAPASTARG